MGPVLGEVGAEHGLGGGAVTACQGRGAPRPREVGGGVEQVGGLVVREEVRQPPHPVECQA